MATMSEKPSNVFGPTLSRRQFVKTGGVLVVGFSLVGPELLKGDTAKIGTMKNSLDPTLPSSWIEIHPDNTVLIRTGKSDFGQGSTFTAYRQIVADELSVPSKRSPRSSQEIPIARRTAAAPSISSAAERRTSARRPPIPTRLCSISRQSSSACRRTSFPSKTASSREAARAFRTATSSRTSN